MKRIICTTLLGACLLFGLSSCDENEVEPESPESKSAIVDGYTCSITAPNGAPAVALANFAVEYNYDNYLVIDAGLITEAFTNGESDFIIAPINIGAMQYNLAHKYKLAAVATWCNLYFATRRADVNSISDLNDKDVTLFGEKTLNSSLAKLVLANENVTPNYSYLGTAEATKTKLVDDADSIVLTAEPAVSIVSSKVENVKKFSIRELYKNQNNGADYAQAGIFVKQETIDQHKNAVDFYLSKIKETSDKISTDLDYSVNNILSLKIPGLPGTAAVLKNALPGCAIKFVYAKDAKNNVEGSANIDISKFGGALPSNDFYYNI